jgi:uncharacterized protein YdeI (YjbR/CyaY-like superfamily)
MVERIEAGGGEDPDLPHRPTERLDVPDDLVVALAAQPQAAANFSAFPPSARKMMLGWVALARRPETRAARITTIVEASERNERAKG